MVARGIDISTSLSNIILDNPVIPASGTFGFGEEFRELYDLNVLGSISFKGTTCEPRQGNPLPRIAETPMGLINSVGLQNPGVEHVIKEELPRLFETYRKPVIANISGFSIDEYVHLAESFEQVDQVGILEVNISCPNVHNGGMAYGVCPESAAEVTRAVKSVSSKPIYIKLSPNVTDIVEIMGMRIDINRRKPVIANKIGGFSGPAIFPVALRMVYQVYEACKIPVIGMGGISSARDVLEMMMAGASAVQVGAYNLVNPWACKEIIENLPVLCDELGIKDIKSIIGAAH